MSPDEKINKLLTEARDKIDLAIEETFRLSAADRNRCIGELDYAGGLITNVQRQIFERHPELSPAPPADRVPDAEMTEEQVEAVFGLSLEQLKKIDNAILAQVSHRYAKVAKVVATVFLDKNVHVAGIPDVFYAKRVKQLVKQGVLESQGDLRMMRYSEVRIARKAKN